MLTHWRLGFELETASALCYCQGRGDLGIRLNQEIIGDAELAVRVTSYLPWTRISFIAAFKWTKELRGTPAELKACAGTVAAGFRRMGLDANRAPDGDH